MPGSVAASLPLTIVFAAAALGAALRVTMYRRLRPAERAGAGFCVAMCAALIAMAWWAEPAVAVWLQVAVSVARPGGRCSPPESGPAAWPLRYRG